jgi:hypothetical protein
MPDFVYGDVVSGGVQNKQTGGNNTMFTVNNSGGVSPGELEAAVTELRDFIARLTREGAVAADGTVTDPAAVVAAVESQPGRLRALGSAIAGGAKEAVLTAVQTGVATLIVALLGRM